MVFVKSVWLSALMVGGGLFAAGPSQAAYSFQAILPPGAATGSAVGIDNAGDVLGDYAAVLFQPGNGFLYSGGTYTTIAVPGAAETDPQAISPNGQYITGYYYDGSGGEHAFVLSHGVYTTLDVAGEDTIYPWTVNDTGEVILDVNFDTSYQGYLYSAGGLTPISVDGSDQTTVYALNAAGEIGGSYVDGNGDTVGYYGLPGAFHTLAIPGQQDEVDSIDAGGDIFGDYWGPGGAIAFSYVGGVISAISPSFKYMEPASVNDEGELVGFDWDGVSYGDNGWVYRDGQFMFVDPPGSVDTNAIGVNDAGEIVGYFSTDGVHYAGFLATPVPEPGVWALQILGVGMAGTALRRRHAALRPT